MLKSGSQIRLTTKEAQAFQSVALSNELPKTEQALAAELERSEATWGAGDSAEEQLMALITQELKEELLPGGLSDKPSAA